MTKRFVLIFLLCFPVAAIAQVFGGNPPGTHWQFIKVPNTTVIFPTGSDSAAFRIAALIDRINKRNDNSIGKWRKPVSILLQPATTISNGYVALAPFRSEFYLTSPRNPFELGSLSWVDQLALHEYRHVEQYSNYNRGAAKLFSIILGEQGQALANALTIPDWFFEGDAVFQETLLSRQGRGRTPAFFNGYRALWEAGIDYSYMKLRNGSLKHFVPDHYELGYQLVAFGRDTFGPEFWKNVTQDAAAWHGVFYPFQKAIKKYSGMPYSTFVQQASLYNKQHLLQEKQVSKGSPQSVLQIENPVFTKEGDLLYLKSSYSRVPAFYRLHQGHEKKIRQSDFIIDHYFSYANHAIVYASYRPDIRWGWINYSEVQILDLETGRQKRITRNSRFFSPAFSDAGDSIITIQIAMSGKQELVLMNSRGETIKIIPNDHDYSFFHPVFWKDKIVVVARNVKSQMTILSIDVVSGDCAMLLPWTENSIGYPHGSGDTLLFSMSHEGRDRICALDLISKRLYLLQNSLDSLVSGQYQPSTHGDEIVYTQFTVNGYTLKKEKIASLNFTESGNIARDTATGFLVNSIHSPDNALSDLLATADLPKQKYLKSKNLFNFHSWQPFYEEPDFSFSILGQNILNTFQSQLYGLYNRNEGYTQLGYTGVFGGFFPYLMEGVKYSVNRRGLFENKTIYWNQFQSTVGVSVPLNLSRGRSLGYITIGSDIVYTRDYFREPEKSKLNNTGYIYLDHDLRFTHQVQQARQEFNPKFAQTVHLNFQHSINRFDSWQFMELSNFYFPGIIPNHSLVINLGGQQRDSSRGVRFSNDFPFARGYGTESFFRTWKWGINYQVPIMYPDKGIWNIVYLLRMRSNFFFDMATVNDQQLFIGKGEKKFRSFGNELFFDTKWWNQLSVSFGIRYSRLQDDDVFGGTGKNRWQFILPVNLLPSGVNAKKYPTF